MAAPRRRSSDRFGSFKPWAAFGFGLFMLFHQTAVAVKADPVLVFAGLALMGVPGVKTGNELMRLWLASRSEKDEP